MNGRYNLSIQTVPPVDLTPYAPRSSPSFTGVAVFGGPVRLSDGTAGTPGLAFDQDAGTGVFRLASGALGIAAAGSERVTVASDAVRVAGVSTVRGIIHGGNSDTVPFIGSFNALGDLGTATFGFGFVHRYTDGHLRLLYRKGTTADQTAMNIDRATGALSFGGVPGAEGLRVVPAANAVNRVAITGAATGSTPGLAAEGADGSVDLALTPKGSGGRVRFGSHTVTADAPITGYVEIRDAGGTVRKLAVIA